MSIGYLMDIGCAYRDEGVPIGILLPESFIIILLSFPLGLL